MKGRTAAVVCAATPKGHKPLMLHELFLPDPSQLCLPCFGDSVPGRMTMWMGLDGTLGTFAHKGCVVPNGHFDGAIATYSTAAHSAVSAIPAPFRQLLTMFQALVNVLTALALVAPE